MATADELRASIQRDLSKLKSSSIAGAIQKQAETSQDDTGMSYEDKLDRTKSFLRGDYDIGSNVAKNIGAGMLDTVVGGAKLLNNMTGTPDELKGDINAYKAMGVEDQPFYTAEGAAQTVGNFLSPTGAANKAAGAIKSGVTKAIEHFQPEKTASGFIEKLGGGKTQLDNTRDLSEAIKNAGHAKKEEALEIKKPVEEAAGSKNIYMEKEEKLPEGNLDKITRIFKGKESATPDEADALRNALKNYRKTGNEEKFISHAEDIFDHEGLSEKQADKLSDMLSVKELKKGSYDEFKDYNWKDRSIKMLHEKFMKKPTFNNAFEFQSELGTEIGELKRLSKTGKLAGEDRYYLKELIKARNAVNKDLDTFVDGIPEIKGKLKEFRNNWRENVEPYRANKTLAKIFKTKSDVPVSGIKPNKLMSTFAEDSPQALQVANDVGSPAKEAIIYHHLSGLKDKDAKSLVDELGNLRNKKNLQDYFTPEIKDLEKLLKERLRNKKYAKRAGVAGAATGGLLTGGYGLKEYLLNALRGTGRASNYAGSDDYGT